MTAEWKRAYDAVAAWAVEASSAGWLEQADVAELARIERQSAEDLFADSARRPLVIGFFGGTGVGKSSLLNRLAGAEIAEVGVERPTSREVTLYLHRDFQLAALPDEFPLERTRISHHEHPRQRDVAWIDMPDIDSAEPANRQLALAWLPYLDWVIYVVSPERYRDDAGWQILRSRGNRHAWLFVMNHWDEARPEQLDEFVADLRQAGFADPQVLRTACDGDGSGDDFERLEQIIHDAIDQHGLAELERLGIVARFDELRDRVDALVARFGDEARMEQFAKNHREQGRRALDRLRESLRWPVELIVRRIAPRESGRWWRSPSASDQMPGDAIGDTPVPWSAQAQQYIDDILAQAVLEAERCDLPRQPVERTIQGHLAGAEERVAAHARDGLQAAVARPGTGPQRALNRLCRGAVWLLPVAAAAWVVYYVVERFYAATRESGSFLGTDFAVHSLLLIALAWFVPWWLYRISRPSLASSVRRGLWRGIEQGLHEIEASIETAHRDLARERRRIIGGLENTRAQHLAARVVPSGLTRYRAGETPA